MARLIEGAAMPDESGNCWRQLSDEDFAAHCRFDAFRGPGPGGQKRNKTSSAVRAIHIPTGLAAVATERRSQGQNRKNALERLRHRLVLEIREPIVLPDYVPPAWFKQAHRHRGRISLRASGTEYLRLMGLILDVLAACGWSVSDAAKVFCINTAALSAFLRRDEHLWAHVNKMRRSAGLKPLIGGRA